MLPLRYFKNCCKELLYYKKIRHFHRTLSANLRCSHGYRQFSLNAVKEEYYPGLKLHGFVVKEVQEIPELCLAAIRLSHEKSGADYLHIAKDDKDNAFGVGFRTTPLDNTGVAHILEHITLCGSQKYPCHDPFFKMICRSSSTFMNAFTACSYTVYPFSTQNSTDFKNLLSVYLDAVFFPRLEYHDFLQEGWRLEHDVPNDSTSPIIFKGVVFNEMKGVYADSDRIFAEGVQNHLLPDHTFANDSGGVPSCIPQLTYNQLKAFHRNHYHPSNSRFFTYGNFPLSNHLKLIEDYALSKFTHISHDTGIPDAKRWTNPRSVTIQCQYDPLLPNSEKQTTVSLSYLLGSSTDVDENFAWSILGLLLIDGPNAPFYKALITPNLGSGYSPLTGFNSHTKEGIFSIGLKGINQNDEKHIIDLIKKTIADVVKNGFPDERIESLLHTIELSLRHQSSQFGINLLMNLMSHWNYDSNPIDFLKVEDMIRAFRANLKNNPHYLQDIVSKYLQKNNHYLTMTMNGTKDFESQRKQEEENSLQNEISKLNMVDRNRILADSAVLQLMQDKLEDVSCLPTLKLNDIERKLPVLLIDNQLTHGVQTQICPQPTNGVLYFRCLLGTKDVADQDKKLLPLLCHILTKMGTDSMSYGQLAQEIEMKTGGLSVSPHLRYDPCNLQKFEEGIGLSSYCLPQNVDAMFNLWEEIFNKVKILDVDRLRTLLVELAADLAADISTSGHRYAMTRAGSSLSFVGNFKESLFGMEQVKFIKSLSETGDLKQISEQLQSLAKLCLTKKRMRIAINCLPEDVKSCTSKIEKLLNSISGVPLESYFKSMSSSYEPSNCRHHLVFPYPVNYVGKCYPGVPFVHNDYAKLKVMSTLMSMKFFLREIREKGGAYGGGATVSQGQFAFYSYRDPKSLDTLETFNQGINWLLSSQVSQSDVDEVKLPIFAEVDRPIEPGNRGTNLFFNEISDEMIEKYRDNLFNVSLNDVQISCEKYLKNVSCHGEAILGNKEAISTDSSWEVFGDT